MISLKKVAVILLSFLIIYELRASTTFNAYVSASNGYIYAFNTSEIPTPEISQINLGTGYAASALAASPNGEYIYVCIPDLGKVVKTITLDPGAYMWDIILPVNEPGWRAYPFDIVISSDGAYAYVVSLMVNADGSSQNVGNLSRINLSTNQAIIMYAFTDIPVALALVEQSSEVLYGLSWNHLTKQTYLTTFQIATDVVNVTNTVELSTLAPIAGMDPLIRGLTLSFSQDNLYVLCNESQSGGPCLFEYNLNPDPTNPIFVQSILGYPDYLWTQLVFPSDTDQYAYLGGNFPGGGNEFQPIFMNVMLLSLDKSLSVKKPTFIVGSALDENYVYYAGSNALLYAYPRSLLPPYISDPSIDIPLSSESTQLQDIALAPVYVPPPPPAPPSAGRGTQIKDDFGLEYDWMNRIFWESSSSKVLGYYIYKYGEKIATVSNSTFFYQDHDIKKGSATIYEITAFNEDGQQSLPLQIIVK